MIKLFFLISRSDLNAFFKRNKFFLLLTHYSLMIYGLLFNQYHQPKYNKIKHEVSYSKKDPNRSISEKKKNQIPFSLNFVFRTKSPRSLNNCKNNITSKSFQRVTKIQTFFVFKTAQVPISYLLRRRHELYFLKHKNEITLLFDFYRTHC